MSLDTEPDTSTQDSKNIRAISRDTVHKICSGQVTSIKYTRSFVHMFYKKIVLGCIQLSYCCKRTGRKRNRCWCNQHRSATERIW